MNEENQRMNKKLRILSFRQKSIKKFEEGDIYESC